MSFQDRVKAYFDNEGFDDIKSIIDKMEDSDRLKALMALLPYGSSKFNGSDYHGDSTRDINIQLVLDSGVQNEPSGDS